MRTRAAARAAVERQREAIEALDAAHWRGVAAEAEAEAQRLQNADEARRAEWRRRIEERAQEEARAAVGAPVQEAAPVGAPVQEAAHVANAETQRVLVLYRTDLGDHNGVVPCVRDHYAFLQFLIEQGFSYTEPDRHNHGIVYERVRPE